MAENKSQTDMDQELQQEVDQALEGQSMEDLLEQSGQAPTGEGGRPAGAEARGDGEAGADEAASTASPNRDDKAAGATASSDGSAAGRHEMRRGRIAAVRGEDVFVEITGEFPGSGKLQGVVPVTQFDRSPRIGAVMDFVVDQIDEGQGLVFLSREGAISRTTWDSLMPGQAVEARVTKSNKGGLELEMIGSIRAFMPASQLDLHHVDKLEDWVGQKVEAKVVEIDRKSKKVLLSRRAYLEERKQRDKAKTLAELEVGQVREGKISNVMDFGAFVDLGGVDGLIHVSDLSYGHVNKPSEVVEKGQDVSVKVLKIDLEKERISLGLKQTQADPWEAAGSRLQPGSEIDGKVTRTAKFGAFVEVEAGIEGLLPMSEISWRRIGKAEEVIRAGDHIKLMVLETNPEKKRLTLSLKQAGGNTDPWTGAEHSYPKDSIHEGTVTSTTDFGAFIELAPGVEGLAHISELADRRVNQVTDVLQKGQQTKARVLSVDEDNHKISLSLKLTPGSESGKSNRPEDMPSPHQSSKPKPKVSKDKLRGGMDLGGHGLGNISLNDMK